MRIESIEINNFRQYRHVHFSFEKNRSKDLHVILGKNGVGKTNTLNAITWCLYGKELHLGDKNTAAEIINNSVTEELKEAGANRGDVSVKIIITADNTRLIFERKSTYSIGPSRPISIKEAFTVSVLENGDWRLADSEEETQTLVHKYIPEEINEYIFFDGEHLEHYFQEGQREKIKAGINDLTQASTIERTYNTFSRFIDQEIAPKLANCGDEEVTRYQNELSDIQVDIENQQKVVEELEKQIHTCEEEIRKCDEILQGNESVPDKVRELNEVENLLAALSKQKDEKQIELFKFTREYYQYFAVYPKLKEFYDYIKSQERDGKLPPKIDKGLIASILNHKHCLICDTDLDKHAEEFVTAIQAKLDISSAVSAELNKSMTAISGFFEKLSKYKERKGQLMKQLLDIDSQSSKAEKKYQDLTQFLRNIPNDKEITSAFSKRDEFKEKKEDFLMKVGAEKLTLRKYEETRDEIEKKLDKAIAKNRTLDDLKEKRDFCEKCKRILLETKEEILRESRLDMEKETIRIFESLLWKKGAFTKVEIEEDYTFRLIDRFNNQTLGSCSAAERALLALSFTLALQKTSKHDSLLFIDTPIGRVDEENRDNFIKTLLSIADEKQVILTFTPTEYDSNVQQLLLDNYSSFSELSMSHSETTIR